MVKKKMNNGQNKVKLRGQGDWLKKIRGGRNIKQMAEMLAISERAYYHYENEERPVPGPVKKLIEIEQWSKVGASGQKHAIHDDWPGTLENLALKKISGFPRKHEFWRAYKLLSEIYKSGDQLYIRALFHNLVAFNNAIQLKQEMNRNNERIEAIENIVKTMDRRTGGNRRKIYEPNFAFARDRRKVKDRRKSKG